MQFQSKTFYTCSFLLCFFLAVLVKFYRESFWGINFPLDVFLGSAPSFLYVFGFISVIPMLFKDMQFSSYQQLWFALTLGSLAYEFEQYWTSRAFDSYDIMATLLAFFLIVFIHRFSVIKT